MYGIHTYQYCASPDFFFYIAAYIFVFKSLHLVCMYRIHIYVCILVESSGHEIHVIAMYILVQLLGH